MLIGEHDVVGRHRLAVLPGRVGSDRERPGRALRVDRPADARSGRYVPSGPSATSPLKMSAARSRSACVRAVSGLIELGRPIVAFAIDDRRAAARGWPTGGHHSRRRGRPCRSPGRSPARPRRWPARPGRRRGRRRSLDRDVSIDLPPAGVDATRPTSAQRRAVSCQAVAAGVASAYEASENSTNSTSQDDRELPQPPLDAPSAAVHRVSPPKVPDRPVPRAWSRIAIMRAMLTMIWPMANNGFTDVRTSGLEGRSDGSTGSRTGAPRRRPASAR